MAANTPTLLTLKQFAARHPAFSEASLRWMRFNEATNGFAQAFKTVGRRVLIDEPEFFAVIERQNAPGAEERPRVASARC